jgi:hypothetical protein
MAYRVAQVSVSDPILGVAKDAKSVRVGFAVPAMGPGGRGIPGIPRTNLQPGQEGIFLLSKHPQEKFYVLNSPFDFVSQSNNVNTADEVTKIRKSLKLLADPITHLKSKDANERLETATLLLNKYRTIRPGHQKPTPIDAEESKLILQTILDADWNQKAVFGQPHPQNLFNQLGASQKDGWAYPRNADPRKPVTAEQIKEAMRDWLKKHVNTYRIERFAEGMPANQPGGVTIQPVGPGQLPLPAPPVALPPIKPKGGPGGDR